MERTTRGVVGRLLADVCAGRQIQVPMGLDFADDLVEAARFHRIAPLVHVALRDLLPDVAGLLRDDRDAAMLRHLQVAATLAGLGGVLDDLMWLVFKGPVLSETAHPVHGIRSYNDLDLLVSPFEMRTTCERLYDAGWRAVFDSELLLGPELPGEIALINASGLWVDLHWSVVLPESFRQRFNVPTVDLLQRRTEISVVGTHAWTLELTDALVHVCHHAALTGAKRLVHLLDADQLARQVQDWDAVVKRASAWGAQPQVSLVLGRARRLFGTPAPKDLRRRLALSPGFGGLMAAVDRVWPVSRLRRGGSVPGMLSRASMPGAIPTLLEALRLGVNDLRASSSKEDKTWRPVGRETLEEYLVAVERAARG